MKVTEAKLVDITTWLALYLHAQQHRPHPHKPEGTIGVPSKIVAKEASDMGIPRWALDQARQHCQAEVEWVGHPTWPTRTVWSLPCNT